MTIDQLAAFPLPDGTVTSAEAIPAGDFIPPGGSGPISVPAFVRVAATLRPAPDSNVRIEVWLPPASAWNDRLLGTGNGGGAGAINYWSLAAGGAARLRHGQH